MVRGARQRALGAHTRHRNSANCRTRAAPHKRALYNGPRGKVCACSGGGRAQQRQTRAFDSDSRAGAGEGGHGGRAGDASSQPRHNKRRSHDSRVHIRANIRANKSAGERRLQHRSQRMRPCRGRGGGGRWAPRVWLWPWGGDGDDRGGWVPAWREEDRGGAEPLRLCARLCRHGRHGQESVSGKLS